VSDFEREEAAVRLLKSREQAMAQDILRQISHTAATAAAGTLRHLLMFDMQKGLTNFIFCF
jgi:hypothetical protein